MIARMTRARWRAMPISRYAKAVPWFIPALGMGLSVNGRSADLREQVHRCQTTLAPYAEIMVTQEFPTIYRWCFKFQSVVSTRHADFDMALAAALAAGRAAKRPTP
jgi:hypothetical protein